jgi:hypothetical protein
LSASGSAWMPGTRPGMTTLGFLICDKYFSNQILV